ncbi:MAG TPA: BBP7 family outer membrane beta-barrel protein [Gemmataceae bacterium]|jgi:hypothetical protein|nr:BBP7 family outer membrane beta-barrel protein [Gemmataceae bacterium]
MRVMHIASLGALVAAAGLAAGQTPPGPSPTNPLAPPQPMPPPAPMSTPQPPSNPSPMPPGAGLETPSAETPLPSPTPVPPPPPTQAAIPPTYPMSAAAWSAAGASTHSTPFSDLAHAYAVPTWGPRAWGNVEYLLWWTKPGPVSVPLVNTTIVPENLGTSPSTGSLNDRLARTIFGDQTVDFGTRSGIRLFGGMWIDCCHETGFELGMFFLPQATSSFAATGGTSPNGTPILTVPFNDVGPGPVVGETAAAIAGPFNGNIIVGTISERMVTNLWGANADMLFNFWKGEFWRFDGIAGWQFMDLYESLDFNTEVRTAPFGSTFDQFRTFNRFYGGDIGGRITVHGDKLGGSLTGKVALGDNVQTLDIAGSSVMPTTFGGGAAPGGLFALSSNSGRTSRGQFSVIPQVNGTVTYDVNCHVTTYIGYDFMYWSRVLRPGDQIDRNINTNLAPVFGGSAAGIGAAMPTRLNRETDFWAHGVSLGVSVKW